MVPILLSANQARKLLRGETVGLKHHQIHHHQGIPVVLRKRKAKTLHSARHKGVGKRIHLDASEQRKTVQHGGAFWDQLVSGFKTAGNWLKNAVQSDTYQKYLKPIVHDVVQNVAKPIADKYVGPLGSQAIDTLGGVTGAYGLRRSRHHEILRPRLDQELSPVRRQGTHLVKGSKEAKEYMAMLRSRKHRGGSFRAS